ncbi:MAG: DUF2207 domain-containing protein [Microgenomates group bacterium]|nr:DUF2207 domain-containing protein [Microgenomates group bacterium]
MKNPIKKIFFIIFFVLITFFFTPTIFAKIFAEQINEFTATINIQKDGRVKIEEKIIYDFGFLYRHGIYRNIPYIKTNKEGKKFKMDINLLSVTDESGRSYQYSTTDDKNYLKIKIGDPNNTITGIHQYIINYVISGALTYFSDHDELYWNVTGNDWTVPILSAKAVVNFPEAVNLNNISKICYTGSLGASEQQCLATFEDSQWVFRTTKMLSPSQGLTIVAGFPINQVARLEPKPVVNFLDTIIGKVVIFFLILLTVFWYLIYPLSLPIKWYRLGRDPSTGSGPTRAWYDPPKTKSGRPLTPAETGTLIDESVDMPDILATVVDLARRGYFKIVEKKKNDFYLIKEKEADVDLLPFERMLFDDIFAGGESEVRIKDAELVETVSRVKKSIYNHLVKEEFFPENPQKIRTFYNFIAFFALITLNFPLVLSALIFGRAMPRKTRLGKEQADVAKSLFNFLTSQERQLTFQADKQMFFEKLLPYAVAFGVEKIWIKRFSDFALRTPSWYQTYDRQPFNSAVFASSLNSSLSSFRASATPTTSSSGFSSGSSGGFSGGGGGGGGGGSW